MIIRALSRPAFGDPRRPEKRDSHTLRLHASPDKQAMWSHTIPPTGSHGDSFSPRWKSDGGNSKGATTSRRPGPSEPKVRSSSPHGSWWKHHQGPACVPASRCCTSSPASNPRSRLKVCISSQHGCVQGSTTGSGIPLSIPISTLSSCQPRTARVAKELTEHHRG